MTLSTTTTTAEATGNGVTLEFFFVFVVADAATVKVYLDDVIQASGFSVTLNEDQGASPGGSVVFLEAPAASVAVSIWREVPLVQTLNLAPYTAFPAESVERALDAVVMQTQQMDRDSTAYTDGREAVIRADFNVLEDAASTLASATASASSASASAAAAAASAAAAQDFLFERVTQPVTFSPADGTSTISATLAVTLSTLAVGASIYYTTDGSKPDATSAVYSAPFDLAAGALVRAVAYLDATGFSEVTEAEYQVNVEVRLPLDTPGDYAQGATMGSGSTSTAVTTSRTTTAGTYVDGAGATQSVAASHLRVGAGGIISEQNATQSFVNPWLPRPSRRRWGRAPSRCGWRGRARSLRPSAPPPPRACQRP
ncbi:MAG: chitobiase/beta-hexosaminidase C-terminal domain-containing protein [Betaproteobacteria bacterium]|nr:chitobiase/beta-hexosaminidase C-terminal domain-containing protein [Betaproteobacteria bacterium]